MSSPIKETPVEPSTRSAVSIMRVVLLFLLAGVVYTLVVAPRGEGTSELEASVSTIEWTTLDGETLGAESWKGDVVILNFFATWCGPCLSETPEFVAFSEVSEGEGVRVIGVSAGYEDASKLRPFVDRFHVPYPIAMGGEELLSLLGRGVLPTTLVLDEQGEVSSVFEGAIGRQHLEQAVAKARAQRESAASEQ